MRHPPDYFDRCTTSCFLETRTSGLTVRDCDEKHRQRHYTQTLREFQPQQNLGFSILDIPTFPLLSSQGFPKPRPGLWRGFTSEGQTEHYPGAGLLESPAPTPAAGLDGTKNGGEHRTGRTWNRYL